MYQLRNLINRRNVPKDPTTNVSACEDFLLHVVEAHILSACMVAFNMSSLDGTPSQSIFTKEHTKKDSATRRKHLLDTIQQVLQKHVDLSIGSEATGDVEEEGNQEEAKNENHVLSYACDVLTLGLLYMEFADAVREGDGERILRCWRYLLLVFKASGRTNYSIEAFTLLSQYHFLFSERMRMQLIWSRTVNVHGRLGKNIPCDLHMEHLNRECKSSIGGLGSNITDTTIQRVGRSLRSSSHILEMFDVCNSSKPELGHHKRRTSETDIAKLLKQIHSQTSVFATVVGRRHRAFPKFKRNMVKKLTKSTLLQWFHDRLHKLILYH